MRFKSASHDGSLQEGGDGYGTTLAESCAARRKTFTILTWLKNSSRPTTRSCYGIPDLLGQLGYGILDRNTLIGKVRTTANFNRHAL